jgi:hypothetical protein
MLASSIGKERIRHEQLWLLAPPRLTPSMGVDSPSAAHHRVTGGELDGIALTPRRPQRRVHLLATCSARRNRLCAHTLHRTPRAAAREHDKLLTRRHACNASIDQLRNIFSEFVDLYLNVRVWSLSIAVTWWVCQPAIYHAFNPASLSFFFEHKQMHIMHGGGVLALGPI